VSLERLMNDDRLKPCQLSSTVSVINFWWSLANCWSHLSSRSVFSSYAE